MTVQLGLWRANRNLRKSMVDTESADLRESCFKLFMNAVTKVVFTIAGKIFIESRSRQAGVPEKTLINYS